MFKEFNEKSQESESRSQEDVGCRRCGEKMEGFM